jgi:hypothetical protein
MYERKEIWEFSEGELEKHFGPHVVITDIAYFLENKQRIVTWLDNSGISWRLQGVVISFNLKQDQLLFKLAWNDL